MARRLKRLTTWGKFISSKEKKIYSTSIGSSVSQVRITGKIDKVSIRGVMK